MKRRDFISGLLGFLAAVSVLGLLFKKKPAGMQSRAMKEWIAEQPNPEDYKDTFDLYDILDTRVPWYTDDDDVSEVLYGNPDAPGPKGILYMAIKETRDLHKLAGSGILK